MRILVANKFWYRRAGLERVMFDEVRWLQDAGHEVAHFSTLHPENDPSPWSGYFSPYIEIGSQTALSARDKAVAVERMFWNAPAAHEFARLLRDFRPHIVHVHGIHRQISASVLVEAGRARVPVVQTLHDYNLVCPSGDLLVGGRFACDPPRCGPHNLVPCVLYGCVHGSRNRSILGAADLFWRRWVLGYERLVSAFISPSQYLARIMVEGRLRRRPIHLLRNAVPAAARPAGDRLGTAFIYAGRLSREKGVATLLRAAGEAGVELVVAGTGPLERELAERAPQGVRFLGRISGHEVDRRLSECRAAVVPSEWAENAPMAVLEPMALGRPVIATRMGGIPEQVRDGVDGILVRAGDPRGLAAALRRLADDDGLAATMGRSAHERAATTFSPAAHLDGLLEIYEETILSARKASR